jgi:hypothetical protein
MMSQIIKDPWDYSPQFTTDSRLKTLLGQFYRRTKNPKPFTSDPNIFVSKLLEYLKVENNAVTYINQYHGVDAILLVVYAQKGKEAFTKWHSIFSKRNQKLLLAKRAFLIKYLNLKGIEALNEYDYLSISVEILKYSWFKNNATP